MTEAQEKVDVGIEARAQGRIAWVRMDNQRRLNAGSSHLVAQLQVVFENLADDADLRAVVLTGAGDQAFMAGADLNELASLGPDSAGNLSPGCTWPPPRSGRCQCR